MNFESFETDIPKKDIEKITHPLENDFPIISLQQLSELCEGNANLEKLLQAFMSYAYRYTNDVWKMELFVLNGGFDKEGGAEEFAELDDYRTRLHNALVDSVAILSRNLAKEGRDNSWVKQLTTDGRSLERSACGKLAILLTYNQYIDSINN